MFYVYILRSEKQPDQTYVGSTADLKNRLAEHNSRKSVHTNKCKPWSLAAYVALPERALPEQFERYLKTGSGRAFMKRHLQTLGYNWYEIPLILQYNKRDAPDRVSEFALQRQLNPDETLPYFTSIASQGIGVIETLKQSINMVLVKLREEL